MDPLTLVVAALAAGARAALRPAAERVVKDAYEGLRRLIKDRYERATSSVKALEEKPTSEGRRAVVREDLEPTKASVDADVLRQARELLDLLKAHDPEAASDVGIDFDEVNVDKTLSISDVEADGSVNISARRAKVGEDLTVSGIRAGHSRSGGDDPEKTDPS